jgi:hypothetical protein
MPSVHHVHPEFGYFCPTPRFRRDVRVAIVSVALGAIVGAGVVTLRATHEREAASALAMTPVVQPITDGARSSDNGSSAIEAAGKAAAVRVDRLRSDLAKADAAKSETAKPATVKSEAKLDGEGREAETGKGDPVKAACEGDTWAYLDGTCVASKPRRVTVRTATDRPAVAAAPLGRSVAASGAAAAPAAAPERSQSAAAAVVVAAVPATPAATSETAAAATTKPHKTVRSTASRRRNDGDPSGARDDRARAAPVYASNGGWSGGGFFGLRFPWQ